LSAFQLDWSKPIPFGKDWRSWSAVDELIYNDDLVKTKISNQTLIIHDLFGVIGTVFNEKNPKNIISYASQKTYLSENWLKNQLPSKPMIFNLLEKIDKLNNFSILKVPKSLQLFEYYLNYICRHSTEELEIVCGFMTKYFTPSLIDIALKYFDDATQSKAHKKARLMYLKKVKSKLPSFEPTKHYSYKDKEYKNLKGTFSDNRIDRATELLIKCLPIPEDGAIVVDLACGNGILGDQLLIKNSKINLHLVDDSYLAMESAKMNVCGDNVCHHTSYRLDNLNIDNIDLVVCNPPFHVENYQTNAIAIQLMRQVKKLLSEKGRVYLVVNIHLKYFALMEVIFPNVKRISVTDKYEVLVCSNE